MAVKVAFLLTEREADALISADAEGRSGWHSRPSLDLQKADFKLITAIHSARAEATVSYPQRRNGE